MNPTYDQLLFYHLFFDHGNGLLSSAQFNFTGNVHVRQCVGAQHQTLRFCVISTIFRQIKIVPTNVGHLRDSNPFDTKLNKYLSQLDNDS